MSEGVIRCPAIRSLVTNHQLEHVGLVAKVQDVVHVLSGDQDGELSSDDPGSIANVAGFFAIHNHSMGTKSGGSLRERLRRFREKVTALGAAASVAAGNETDRAFSLEFFKSGGDHPGTVDFFTNDANGAFDAAHFDATTGRFAPTGRLTIDGIAAMIIEANAADPKASDVDLGKSAGEWALMVSALGTEIDVAELKAMYQGDSSRLLAGTAIATARQWLATTVRISKTIAAQKAHTTATEIAMKLHSAFGDDFNEAGDNLCPCIRCSHALWA
jgi:hypothetical protein